jgi:predicted secreted protein
MPSGAISGFGTLLKLGDGATPTEGFTTIGEVKDIGGPDLKLNTADVTNHSSTDGWKEKIGTLLEGGQVAFKVNFIPTTATHSFSTGLIKDMVNRTKRNFKLVFPDTGATTWTFAALVTQFKPNEPVDGALEADVTLDITGKPTLA